MGNFPPCASETGFLLEHTAHSSYQAFVRGPFIEFIYSLFLHQSVKWYGNAAGGYFLGMSLIFFAWSSMPIHSRSSLELFLFIGAHNFLPCRAPSFTQKRAILWSIKFYQTVATLILFKENTSCLFKLKTAYAGVERDKGCTRSYVAPCCLLNKTIR